MTNFTKLTNKEISALNGPELLALFNEAATLVGAPICKRFSSLTSGFQRTMKLVDQARAHEAEHGTVAATPAMNPLKVTAEFVAKKVAAAPKTMIQKAKAPKGAKVWEVPEDGSCPQCNAPDSDITPAGKEGTAAEHRNFCHHCSLEWDPQTGKQYNKPKETEGVRSKAVADTWADAAVRAKRCERNGVKVTGGGLKAAAEFKSVGEAFRTLRLPMGKHIKFRGALKAAGKLAFEDYMFVITERPAKKSAPAAK